MKTILKIIIIMLVAGVVAGGLSLAVNNSAITSASNDAGQPPALTGSDSQTTTQPMERPEGGDRESGSIVQGLPGVFGTLLKLTAISIVVLFLQKGVDLLGKRRLTLKSR